MNMSANAHNNSTDSDLKVWRRTLKLGIHKTADEYRNALKSARYNIGGWANDILSKPEFTYAQQETEVELEDVSVEELGFKDEARYSDICTRAGEKGFDPCPAEAGPALRLAYRDQPMDEWLRIAMKAIIGSDGGSGIFAVGHGGDGLWLSGRSGYPTYIYYAPHRFVFVRRKSQNVNL